MKEDSNQILDIKIAERNDRAKKLYRYVNDVARRVDEAITACTDVSSLFSTQIEIQRLKLKDNCEKLIFLDPSNYGKRTLELLWRKVYYDTVSTAKKLVTTEKEYDSYLFTHIVCGIGHFHHLISRIQTEFNIQCKEMDYMTIYQDEEIELQNKTIPHDNCVFGKSALHSCLIYLGDLSRYQAELFHTFDPSLAARYYSQAAHIDRCLGMPYNQLGNLYLDKNYNLDSACYYIHCLSCDTPFEGALGNLTKIFEKNLQIQESIIDSETHTQAEHIQSTVVNFLSLIELWYQGKNDTNIPQRCNTIAQQLKLALDFNKPLLPDMNKNYQEYNQLLEEENMNPSYLNGDLIHNIVQICLFTIAKMVEGDEDKAFACKAFTLALLSQLLQKLLQQIKSIGLRNPALDYVPRQRIKEMVNKVENDVEINVLSTNSEKSLETTKENGKENSPGEKEIDSEQHINNFAITKTAKKTLAKRRRRRRLGSTGSSDMSEADTENSEVEESSESDSDDNPLSDTSYETDDSTTDAIQDSGEISDCKPKQDQIDSTKQINIINKKTENNKINGHASNHSSTEKDKVENGNELNVEALQSFLLGDNILPSLKLLQDWVLNEKELILSCGDSGETLFQCVVDLLNIFTFYFHYKKNGSEEIKTIEYVKHIAKNLKLEYKSIPLPEDINLRATTICKFDKDAAEWQIIDKYKPSLYEENVIRILNFLDFGNQVAKIVPRIRFNRTVKIFYLKKISPPKINTKSNHKKTREWHNSKHGDKGKSGLPRLLGRLWLTSQVRELEKSGHAPEPSLLVLDADALNKHLRRVKQLLRTRNFILLIPTIVLQELDDMKREQITARDAIRWLEEQLRSGSRFLRAQRPGQSRPLPLLKYPRKAPPHVHNFMQILEFCNHFVGDDNHNQGGNGDPDSSVNKSMPLLILLVGNEPREEEYKEFSLTGAAQSAGISIENIEEFYAKWRQTSHKNGKKR